RQMWRNQPVLHVFGETSFLEKRCHSTVPFRVRLDRHDLRNTTGEPECRHSGPELEDTPFGPDEALDAANGREAKPGHLRSPPEELEQRGGRRGARQSSERSEGDGVLLVVVKTR